MTDSPSVRRTARLFFLALVLYCALPKSPLVGQTIIRVDSASSCTVGCDGSDWTLAYEYLQDALFAASGERPFEIWVAKGSYYPDDGSQQTTGNQNATFQLLNGVEMYGGFASGETERQARDLQANPTILSGQIAAGTRSKTVVTGSGTDATSVLDGFWITRGYTSGFSGGITNSGGSPTLRNLIIADNYGFLGSGMHNRDGSSPFLVNVVFFDNGVELATTKGGGMYNTGSSNPTLVNVTFAHNSAVFGRSMANYDSSNPVISNVVMHGYFSSSDHMYNDASTPTIKASLIQGSGGSGSGWNTAFGIDAGGNLDSDPLFVDMAGGDVRLKTYSPAIDVGDDAALPADVDDLDGDLDISEPVPFDAALNDRQVDAGQGGGVDIGAFEYQGAFRCPTFRVYADLDATGLGDGVSWTDAVLTLQDGLFIAEHCSVGEMWVAEGIYYPDDGSQETPDDEFAAFQLLSGVEVYGGFVGGEAERESRNWQSNPTILSGYIGAGSRSWTIVEGSGTDGTAVLDGFAITGAENSNIVHGGGITNDGGSPTLRNLFVYGNQAPNGAGIHNRGSSSPTLVNVVFSGNKRPFSGGYGAGMYNTGSSNPTLINVTFSHNTATFGKSLANLDSSNPVLQNVVMYDGTIGAQIYNDSSTPVISNSLIGGSGGSGTGWNAAFGSDGGGNVDLDPLFVDFDGVDDILGTMDDNPRLSEYSPAIDAGDDAALPLDTNDLDGDLDTSEPIPFDLDANQRQFDAGVGGSVDMGAYEYQSTLRCPGSVVYVDQSATGLGDGFSWTDATPTLQDGLFFARNCSVGEIWVAAGTYFPDEGREQTPDDILETFQLLTGVGLYGGFAGGETSRNSRDWQANPTILSGLIDTGVRSLWVVTGSSTDEATVLDGFRIIEGGLSETAVSGGIYNNDGSPVLRNLVIRNNLGVFGAGIRNTGGSSPSLTNVVFINNGSTDPASRGGALYNTGSSHPTVVNVTFAHNSATFGRSMANYDGSNPVLSNVIMDGTVGFTEIYNEASTPVINNSLIRGSGGSGPGWIAAFGTDGGGNLDGDPQFVDLDGADNILGTTDDDLRLQVISTAIDAGNDAALPADVDDLDGDLDTSEPIPFDIALNNRQIDGGMGGGVDMGAYEYDPADDLLPVTLSQLDAVSDGEAIRLSWTVTSETNCAGFGVEHLSAPDIAGGTVTDELWEEVVFLECAGSVAEQREHEHVISGLNPGEHTFRLRLLDLDGSFSYSERVLATVEMSEAYRLEPVYPNPFNPRTVVSFGVRQAEPVKVALYDVQGRQVRLLFEGTPAGGQMLTLQIDGSALPSGMYFVRFEGERFMVSEAVVLLK